MSRYTFTVPPTAEMGSYKATCSSSANETFRQNALWDYNNARQHDNLPPLSRMPAGTSYHRHYVFVIQQHTGKEYGWEDVNEETTRKEALRSVKEYRDNQPEYPARIRRKAS